MTTENSMRQLVEDLAFSTSCFPTRITSEHEPQTLAPTRRCLACNISGESWTEMYAFALGN